MLVKDYMEKTFADSYGINVDEYRDVQITTMPFSIRAINRFTSNEITTVAELLNTTPAKLMTIRGFGKTCLDMVEDFCASLQSSTLPTSRISRENLGLSVCFVEHLEEIALGDFAFLEQGDWSEQESFYADVLKNAYDALGGDLTFTCFVSPERVRPIIDMLVEFCDRAKLRQEMQELLWQIPSHRRNKKAIWYINAFTINDEKRNSLKLLCGSENTTIAEFVCRINTRDERELALVKKFLKWCSFDLSEDICFLLEKLYVNDRARLAIQLRAAGRTLEQAGSFLGVTKERVRQIENKVKRTFARLYGRTRIVSKIAAEHNGKTVVLPMEISHCCGSNCVEFMYLLQNYEGSSYTYDKQLDVFIVEDDSLHARIDAYLEALPNMVPAERMKQLALAAEEDENIPREMFERAFLEIYQQTGAIYHRSRLSLSAICQDILGKYFPNGMHVYNSLDIEEFREFVRAEYGDIRIPENNRALTARISAVGILCGRGMYRARKNQYMPKELLDKIYDYIVCSDSPVFLTSSLFTVFEDELYASGIDNRYYLQGILHEAFGSEFSFKRDYISKDDNITSIYTAIVNFIKKSKYPVSKQLIQEEFPGITDIVISFAVGDPEVLNYFGEYLHASRLVISEDEQQYLYDIAERVLIDSLPHHVKDFYEIISREKSEILTRNAIMYPFGAYSLLEYLFREQFQFLRPYIAPIGIEIGRSGERLKELIYSTDRISITDIRLFAKENWFQIQSIIEYINACNDEFLLIDRDTMMRIEKVNVNESIARQIEECVAQTVTHTIPIHQLTVWGKLPALSVPWTDWLLYSIINKWGSRLSVGTSSNQMKMAVPLVAPLGELTLTGFSGPVISSGGTMIKIDNLDNLDELLEDIIGDGLWEEPYEF